MAGRLVSAVRTPLAVCLGVLLVAGPPSAADEVRWIDVPSGCDPTSVTAAISALGDWLKSGEIEGSRLVHLGDRIAVYGTEAQYELASRVIRELPPREALVAETVRLHYLRKPAVVADLLTALASKLTPAVTVSGVPADSDVPILVLVGRPEGVRELKALLQSIDVPQPEITLTAWAYQFSGEDEADVRRRAREAADLVQDCARLSAGYLSAVTRQGQRYRGAAAIRSEASVPSVTQSLTWLLGGTADGKRRVEHREVMEKDLRRWVGGLSGDDLALLGIPTHPSDRGRPSCAAAEALLPTRLLGLLEDEQFVGSARDAIGRLAKDWSRAAKDVRSLGPDDLPRRIAEARFALGQSQDALSEAVEHHIHRPVNSALAARASVGAGGGLEAAASTTVTVLSGCEAKIVGAAMSYAEVTTPASGATTNVKTSSLPEALISLALEAGGQTQTWQALSDGVELTVQPTVLPDAHRLELQVVLKSAHNDPGEAEDTLSYAVPRVAVHSATTTVYATDLSPCALSSFALRTTHPRPDWVCPVLGGLPLVGNMFRFPRSPVTLHHESLLVLYPNIRHDLRIATQTLKAMDKQATKGSDAREVGVARPASAMTQ